MSTLEIRFRFTLLLAASIAGLSAPPAAAYQHLSLPTGGDLVSPDRWQSLPIPITVDNGPTDISAEIDTALAAWNDVATARDPWAPATKAVDAGGQPVNFTKANFGTAWGNLTGDGKQEVIFDEDGSALTALGLAPDSVNGFGPNHEVIRGGTATIDDMYLVINGSRTNFDRQSTEVHELGHTLGIAHSSVGFAIDKNGALSPELESQVPTMHPFSIAGTGRRTLEADDVAALSELYPDEPSFTNSLGTITGTVTRCGSGEPVLGANVRAINVANPTIQLTRVTGFDGATDGSYTIHGVPPGTYNMVVEPLAGDVQYLRSLAMFTPVDTDFIQEFLNPTNEGDCAKDNDPNARESIPVGAFGTQPADFKVDSATLALVVDVTGSMGPEIGAVKTGLNAMITALAAAPGSFPDTAIVTFEDAARIRTVSRDPDTLRSVIDGLTTHSTPDCPEGSNEALMTAGRLLGSGGRAVLVTDAESHPTGPTRAAVEALYTSKGARLNVLLSGSCAGIHRRAGAAAAAAPLGTGGASPDRARPREVLGAEGSIRTFSEESLFTGGLFSLQPGIKSGTADAVTRYSNTLANVAISAVMPAVAAVDPSAVPQGTTLDLELAGSNTGFRPGSTVAVAGSGVSVTSIDVRSPTRIVVRLTAAPDAALGFRDVTVSTDRGDGSIEAAKGIGALQVVDPPSAPAVLSVTPDVGTAGATEDVRISGGLTHFATGTSVAGFGAGVTVNHLTVESPTAAVANVTAAPGAAIGFRQVTVQTGGEVAGEGVPGPFLVAAAPPPIPRLTSASPRKGARGSTVDVVLEGADTAFASGTSLASVRGTGVKVLATTVTSPTSAVARLRIAGDAPLGFRDMRVTTGAEDAALLDGFEVTPGAAPPVVPQPTPAGAGPPSTCSDRALPRASFLNGTQGVRAQHGRLQLRGHAGDAGCVADISVAGGVARVEVAISRTAAGHRCRFVTGSGRLTGARSCSKPVFLAAKGTTTWSLSTKGRLPRGTYTIQLRARDVAGNRQATATKRTVRVS